MKLPLLLIVAFSLTMAACKKDNQEPEEPEFDGAYPGKVKDINGNAWKFYYTEDGKIAKYEYNYYNVIKTSTITWESNQVTCNHGIGYNYIRPLNSAGYAIPGNGDVSSGQNWTYNSDNTIAYYNGTNYYWSNGNIDSLIYGSIRTYYEYTNDLETRDYGARYIPRLKDFPVYNLNVKNLKSKLIQVDGTDTLSIKLFSYTFNANNQIATELLQYVIGTDTTNFSLDTYHYYE